MSPPRRQSLPPSRNVDRAIDASAPLAALLAGHRRSGDLFTRIAPGIPPALRSLLRPGPLAEGQWTLFVEHNAAAAKLRQYLPALQAAAMTHEPGLQAVKIKVLARGG